MAYDSIRHVVVLFGGEGPLGDTWEWDGNSWMQIAVTGPSARDESAMVFDSKRGVVVLFGGGDHNNPQALGETWEYPVGGMWVRRANSAGPGATTGPSPRVRHAMVYDSIRGKTVLFGGLDASGPGGSLVAQADTWEWDGTAWTLRATTGPAARTSHAMAYDIARSQTVLFGGFGDIVYGDTWEWDGTAWTQKATTGPSARYDSAIAYAGGCPRTMLFGGYDSSGGVGNNWEWDGSVWTPLTTGPSARNGHKMAYDSFRRRFVLFGGYSLPAGPNAETWEFIAATPSTFRGGHKDNFALPIDPTVRSDRLNKARPTVTWKGFDDTTSNRYIGHTFSNLPANIIRAELIIRMRPHHALANNDSLHLGMVDDTPPGTWAWQLNIVNIPGGGTWNVGHPATTFTLDLGNLPTGVNILSKLATDRYLDLMVQDDTAIDWVDLRIWTCPRRPYFFGLPHTALGQAQLTVDANRVLRISNIGSSGQDGVSVDVGQSGGLTSIAPIGFPTDAPDGAYMEGTAVHNDAQLTTSIRLQRSGDVVRTVLDFTALGAASRQVKAFHNGELVATVVHSSSWDVEVSPSAAATTTIYLCTGGDQRDNTAVYKWIKGVAVNATLAGGQLVTADTFEFRGVNPQTPVIYTSETRLRGSGLSEMMMSTEQLVQLGVFHAALGQATLEAPFGSLIIGNLGSSGQDGVTIDFGRVDSFDVGLDPIVDREGNPLQFIGAYLEATAIGSLNGVQSRALGQLRIAHAQAGTYDIFADFTAIGSSTQRVQVFNQGALVADLPGHSGPVGTASAWMNRIGKLGGQTECFVCRWPGPTSFVINSGGNDTSYVGDELRILAEGATQAINYKSGLQLLAAGIPEITLTDVQAVPQRPATLGNISTRLQIGTGDRVMIAGFIVRGSAPKRVLIRAAGPSLTQFGLSNALANPWLELHDTNNTIGMNDNWQTTQIGGVITSDQVAEIQTSGLAPSHSVEPAIIATLLPGSYTAIVQGVNGGIGVGTAEVYDLDATSGSFLANISSRGFVQTGNNIMIGGFIIVAQSTRVIARAIGPSLTPLGVPGALANPTLELRDSNGVLLRANNDWEDDPAQAAELTTAGLAPTNQLESGLAATLPPGLYTVLLAGVDNGTGVGLVEVYDLGAP